MMPEYDISLQPHLHYSNLSFYLSFFKKKPTTAIIIIIILIRIFIVPQSQYFWWKDAPDVSARANAFASEFALTAYHSTNPTLHGSCFSIFTETSHTRASQESFNIDLEFLKRTKEEEKKTDTRNGIF
jgi:hypothetical protein